VLACLVAGVACRQVPPSERDTVTVGRQERVENAATVAAAAAAAGSDPDRAPLDVAGPAAEDRTDGDGVSSRRLQAGSGTDHPADNDRVALSFASWKRDGTLVTSARGRGSGVRQTVSQLLPGVATVVKTMVVGERRLVWLDAGRTCVEQDDDPPSCAGALTFDIQLVGLEKAPATPVDVAAPPPEAQRTPDGVPYVVLHAGPGNAHPRSDSRVTVLHSAWTTQGVLFESSAMAHQATQYVVHELPRGLREGVQLMTPGEKARFWLPAPDARSARLQRGLPKGPTVYDVELLAFD
jgi:FKBP-type peptidyl-prolyl cis-trans isomerase